MKTTIAKEKIIARLLPLSGLLLLASACSSQEGPAMPAADCSLDGNACSTHEAIAVGTELAYFVSWQATCKSGPSLPDTGPADPCDQQPYTAHVVCEGGPCE